MNLRINLPEEKCKLYRTSNMVICVFSNPNWTVKGRSYGKTLKLFFLATLEACEFQKPHKAQYQNQGANLGILGNLQPLRRHRDSRTQDLFRQTRLQESMDLDIKALQERGIIAAR